MEAEHSPPAASAPRAGLLAGAALMLVGSVLVPLTPGGSSFLGIVAEVMGRSWAEAGLFVLSFGGPYLFGLTLAAAAIVRSGPLPRVVLQSTLALFQAQLFLWALRAWLAGFGIMSGALFGFALVSAMYLMYFSAKTAAESNARGGPSIRWLAQWGALLVVGLGGWLRLQIAAGLKMGPAVEVAIAAAVLILIVARRR